ncbi:hypothetical protein, partial [Ruegeria aquimaris]
VAGFYTARSRPIPPLPWQTFAPPFSNPSVQTAIGRRHRQETFTERGQVASYWLLTTSWADRYFHKSAPPSNAGVIGFPAMPLGGTDRPARMQVPDRSLLIIETAALTGAS